ncbi:hypothetical protein EXIGLDRAFT_832315 [Exidia glandulosa HHB12029]|uniref:Uncharacterized protein n=1 Tax=Exidia glandulosa HHB12029 TaxID=1314781 RepID=A0A165LRG3_EXIGL|nr:hypothetical protein EXIGLDRAFT_832315 [Exidia glandulosa HHB12029]
MSVPLTPPSTPRRSARLAEKEKNTNSSPGVAIAIGIVSRAQAQAPSTPPRKPRSLPTKPRTPTSSPRAKRTRHGPVKEEVGVVLVQARTLRYVTPPLQVAKPHNARPHKRKRVRSPKEESDISPLMDSPFLARPGRDGLRKARNDLVQRMLSASP